MRGGLRLGVLGVDYSLYSTPRGIRKVGNGSVALEKPPLAGGAHVGIGISLIGSRLAQLVG